MEFQPNGSNSESATSGLIEATSVFNGASNVRRVVADPTRENVLVLPAGVTLDDIAVRGDDLVIQLPDGTQMVVVDAAIHMPEIVIDGVTIPPMNLAALLDSDLPEPAAGNARSSGGNFADPVNPIDPAYAIGDLLPYTELFFPEPQDEEIIPELLNNVPEITFIPVTGDGTVVDEHGLPARDGEPAGTMDETDDESTTGTIRYVSADGTDRLLIDGLDIFALNDEGEVVILEPFVTGYPLGNGVLVVNAVDLVNGSITYTYTLTDNTSGDDTFVEFDITVIDPDGDSDTGTARIDVIDDAPFTNDDGLLATLDDNAAGVVVGTVAQLLQNDEYGADGAGSPAIVISTGSLGGTISIVNGQLVYSSGANVAPGASATETFTYTIKDGDGDVSNTSTFTIILTDDGPTIGAGPADIAATITVDEEGIGGIPGGPANDLPGEATVQSGTLAGLSYGTDGPGNVVLAGATYSQLITHAGNPVTTTWNGTTHVLTGRDSVTGDPVFTIELATDGDGVPTGAYTFTLLSPVVHPSGGGENDVTFQITAVITDAEGDSNTGVITITIDDDSPVIDATEAYVPDDVTLDESPQGEDEDVDATPAAADPPAGTATVDFDFTDAFSLSNDPASDQSDFGADGPGEVTYTLVLSANYLQSGLFALDVSDAETIEDGYGQGEPILLFQLDDNTVIGYVGEDPAVGGADYDVYFTITVDAETGKGTFTQSLNVWHADTTNDDDTAFLDIVDGDLFLEATATDFDNDSSDPAQLSIGHDVFQIQDDGPAVNQSSADTDGVSAADPLVAAEGNLLDNDTVGTDSEGDFNGRVVEIVYGDPNDGGSADGLGPDGLGPLVLVTEYGTLTVQQNGDYSFVLDATNAEIQLLASQDSLDVEFTYTFTDGDGDPESQTLTITIAGSNQPPIGASEAVTVSEEGLADDQAAPIGNADTTDDPYNVGSPAGEDNTDLAHASGQFVFTDADDADVLTYSIAAPAGTYYAADGSAIVWSSATVAGITTLSGTAGVDGPTVMSVVLDTATGEYDVYLEGPVYHDLTPNTVPTNDADGLPAGDGNVESEFTIVFAVEVSDGTVTVDTSLSVTIEDDSPIVTSDGTFSAPALIVDDSDLGSDSASFAGAFDISFGGDGEFDVLYALGLSEQGVSSGLTETTSGLAINLFLIDGTVYGSTASLEADVDADAMTNVAFTIDVDGEGEVTLDQLKPVVHDDNLDPEEAAPLAAEQLASAGLVTLTATAYDQDGDYDSATVDIGDAFFFEDDGPSITVTTPDDTGILATSDANIVDSTSTDTSEPIDPNATLNLADVFGYSSPDFGNDGDGGIVETYGLNILDDGATGLTSGGLAITLEYYDDGDGATASVRGVTSEGTVFTVVVNTATGAVTLTQTDVLDHAIDTDQISLPDGFLEATYSVTITDGDGDFVTKSESVDLGGNLLFYDDAPDIDSQGTVGTLTLDESPLAEEGDGVYTATADFSGNFTLDNADNDAAGFGNDTPGVVTYAMNLGIQDVFSGLYALDNSDTETAIDPVGQGEAIKLYQLEDGTIIGYTGDSPSVDEGTYTTFFTISANAETGEVTFAYDDQVNPANIWHGSTASDDDAQSIDGIQLDANVLTLQATATDYDNDTNTASIDLGQGTFVIEDDGPEIETPASDSEFEAVESGTYPLIATGTLGFDVGTDGYLGGSVEKAFTFDLTSGTVGGVAIYNISDPVFDPSSGTWTFTFDYTDSNGDTQTAGGFVDVAANGTDYTVALDTDFEFTTVDQFSDVVSRTGYNLTGNSPSQYEIVVSQLDTDDPVYVQFQAYNGTLAANGNAELVGGETVTGSETWASVTNTDNGVAGDTIQAGEVLDFDLFTSNPGGTYSDNGTLGADGLTLLLDGFGSEDLIVILKLEDANDPTITTTKILIVGQEDVYTIGDVIPGYTVTLDQNDGFIVIESNDFNTSTTNWVITGAQLLSSADGLANTSTGIELNGDVGSTGGTAQTTVTFAAAGDTYDNDVVKITDIGLIRTVADEQAVTLNFDVTVTDGDGDTETDSFTVNPVAEPIVPPIILDIDGDGIELVGMEAGVTYDYLDGRGEVATAWIDGSDDGILARWDGESAFDADDFVFGDNDTTDLEALAAYDTNGDNVLSGAELAGFGVWMDNGDGDFADSEYMSLEDLGITGISLVTDGPGYLAAGGDAVVYGEGSYMIGDTSYILADVGFGTSSDYEATPEANQLRQAEMALLAAAAPGLLVASALEATPFFAGDHVVNYAPTDLTFAKAVDSITRPDLDLSHVTPVAQSERSSNAQEVPANSAHRADDDGGHSRGLGGDHGAPANDVADLGASTEAGASFAPPPTPAGGDAGADLLGALLTLVPDADAKGNAQGTQALDAIRAAITEATGADDVSQLVNQIIDNVPQPAQHGHVGTEAMQVLLNSGVAGQHFQMPMLPDAADDAAHLAAAAA